ncbi:nuclear transcription factor Y subunit C-2-like [Andrographis paniculata]|uniref:nuclear transcription factor Y subunit C-2-like n=1 Tax=Andrographis paniculata TaxID=175694 RepID=UPI0021E89750|nr:nuclear transcription factor Y subunit C-2-like [Andrographis paniculata]
MRQAGAYSKLVSEKSGPYSLPLARIKKIMKKSSDDVKMISGEAPIVFSMACDLLVQDLTKRAWAHTLRGNKIRRTMHRDDVAAAILATDIFDFLLHLLPPSSSSSSSPSPSAPPQSQSS